MYSGVSCRYIIINIYSFIWINVLNVYSCCFTLTLLYSRFNWNAIFCKARNSSCYDYTIWIIRCRLCLYIINLYTSLCTIQYNVSQLHTNITYTITCNRISNIYSLIALFRSDTTCNVDTCIWYALYITIYFYCSINTTINSDTTSYYGIGVLYITTPIFCTLTKDNITFNRAINLNTIIYIIININIIHIWCFDRYLGITSTIHSINNYFMYKWFLYIGCVYS